MDAWTDRQTDRMIEKSYHIHHNEAKQNNYYNNLRVKDIIYAGFTAQRFTLISVTSSHFKQLQVKITCSPVHHHLLLLLQSIHTLQFLTCLTLWPSPSLLVSLFPCLCFCKCTFACVTHSQLLIINKSMQMQSSLSPLCTTDVHNELLYRLAHDAAEIL